MPLTDASAMQIIDLRNISSDWSLICPVHGGVYTAIQFNADWDRTYCQDCFEASLPTLAEKLTLDTGDGPDPMVMSEPQE